MQIIATDYGSTIWNTYITLVTWMSDKMSQKDICRLNLYFTGFMVKTNNQKWLWKYLCEPNSTDTSDTTDHRIQLNHLAWKF